MSVYDDSSNPASPISYRQNTLKIPQPSQVVIIEEPSVAGSAGARTEDASEIERGEWRTGLELGARVILVAHTARRDRGSLNCCLSESTEFVASTRRDTRCELIIFWRLIIDSSYVPGHTCRKEIFTISSFVKNLYYFS